LRTVWLVMVLEIMLFCLAPGRLAAQEDPAQPATVHADQHQHELEQFVHLLKVQFGDSMDRVIEILGEPNQRINTPDRNGRPSSRMAFDYGRLGMLVFEDYTPKNAAKAHVTFIDYRIAGHLHSLGDDFIGLVMQTDNVQALSAFAQQLQTNDALSAESLRLLATRLERHYTGTDRFQANALSFICLILAKKAGVQYEPLLHRVEAGAGTRKLRKHAREAINMVRDDARREMYRTQRAKSR
jgi:hypothetical protein